MSSSPKDPFVALWQSAPKPDMQNLLQDLQSLRRMHQRLNWIVLAIGLGLAVLFAFEEATGRINTHGLLSLSWIAVLVSLGFWHRRAQCRASDTFACDTVSLLKSMIARARSGLFVARCLYAGVPLGAIAGFVVMGALHVDTVPKAHAVSALLEMWQVGAGISALLIMMAVGFVLARSWHRQVQDLTEKLRSLESDP